jgi:hypothetical protein
MSHRWKDGEPTFTRGPRRAMLRNKLTECVSSAAVAQRRRSAQVQQLPPCANTVLWHSDCAIDNGHHSCWAVGVATGSACCPRGTVHSRFTLLSPRCKCDFAAKAEDPGTLLLSLLSQHPSASAKRLWGPQHASRCPHLSHVQLNVKRPCLVLGLRQLRLAPNHNSGRNNALPNFWELRHASCSCVTVAPLPGCPPNQRPRAPAVPLPSTRG